MTDTDYEARYAEAVGNLKRTTKAIGAPSTTLAGTRFIQIDGATCTDETVFRLAWGEEIARKIVSQHWIPRR